MEVTQYGKHSHEPAGAGDTHVGTAIFEHRELELTFEFANLMVETGQGAVSRD